jgi:hypothetical protein
MPTNVRRFVWLWCASIALGALAVPMLRLPIPSEVPRPFVLGVIAGVLAIEFALFLPFFWLAVWRRKNWARWVLLAGFVSGIPLLFVGPGSLYQQNPAVNGIALLSFLVEASGFYFLFTGNARPWFRQELSN